MNTAAAITAGMNVLSRALPARILLVDDDELELELMYERLVSAGYDVVRANDAQEALACFERQWFPVVLTDMQMPGMDGLKLTEKLRSRALDDTYIIMFSGREDGLSYERGYFSGVDDYVTKHVPDIELLARIEAGLSTLTLRRSLKQARAALESVSTVDVQSGAYSTRHLLSSLHSEMQRARRYQRHLSVIIVQVARAADDGVVGMEGLDETTLQSIVRTLQKVVRLHVDWVARIGGGFAVVLPETNLAATGAIQGRIRKALQHLETDNVSFRLAASSLDASAQSAELDPLDFLRSTEKNCRPLPAEAAA
jgi:two-component system cell cycle response regulator